MSLDKELIKVINSRLGLSGISSYNKILSLSSNSFKGGIVKGEQVFFILLTKEYEHHIENFYSIRCDDKNHYIGFSFIKEDFEIENIVFYERSKDSWIPSNTSMKLSLTLFIEMFANMNVPPIFLAGEDHSLFEFEKFYISLYPEDM